MSCLRCRCRRASRRAFPGAIPETDRGSATLWLLSFGLLLAFASVAGVLLGEASLARHRAETAADLAALAAARHTLEGAALACGAAAGVATANGGRLSDCVLTGTVATVRVEIPLHGALQSFSPATARSRAGPAGSAVPPG